MRKKMFFFNLSVNNLDCPCVLFVLLYSCRNHCGNTSNKLRSAG